MDGEDDYGLVAEGQEVASSLLEMLTDAVVGWLCAHDLDEHVPHRGAPCVRGLPEDANTCRILGLREEAHERLPELAVELVGLALGDVLGRLASGSDSDDKRVGLSHGTLLRGRVLAGYQNTI